MGRWNISWPGSRRFSTEVKRSRASHEGEECVEPGRPLVHLQRLHLSRQRIPSPTEQLGRFLPVTVGLLQRNLYQRFLKLRQRFLEQWPLVGGTELTFGPGGKAARPFLGLSVRQSKVRASLAL